MNKADGCPECERERKLSTSSPPPSPREGTTGSSDASAVEEEGTFAVISRVPEGMDPETGNYIRPISARVITNQPAGGHYGPNIMLEPPGSDFGEKADKQCQTSTGIQRAQWSRRLASTLSNRSRPADEDEEEWSGNCIFGKQIRFTIMAISTLCLSSILSNILTFNFTYICMAGERPENFTAVEEIDKQLGEWEEEEWEELGYNPKLDYSSQQRSVLFMAVAVGALLAVFPLTLLLNRFGSRLVFGLLGYVSGVATLLLPAAANLGFPFILAVRIVQGAAFSACLPVMGSVTSHWSTLEQNGIFIAILSSFLQIAPIFTMPISGVLCVSKVGWTAVYYLHGLVSIVLFTMFLLYHRNTPTVHPMVSRPELVKVMFNKGGSIYSGPASRENSKRARAVPYRAIYGDLHIWAILVASFGNFMGTQLSLQFMPTYINKVLHMPVERTGTASAISPIIMFFIKLLAGQSSDRIKFISDNVKLRIYNTLSMGMMGLLFIVLAMLNPQESPNLCLVVLIASTCILGFNSGGFFKSSQQVSRQHSHFTLANISFLNCVCMLLTPLLNEVIAPENEPKDWAIVLWIHGLILTATNGFFCLFASANPARWTLDTANQPGNRRRGAARVGPTNGGDGRQKGRKDVEGQPA